MNLRRLRKQSNLTQEGLAQLVGVSRITLMRWEAGTREPGVSEIRRLCEALNVTEADLLNGPADNGEVRFTIIWEKVSDMGGMEARMNEFKIGSGDDDAFGCFRFAKDVSVEEIGRKFMNELMAARAGWEARDAARKKLET